MLILVVLGLGLGSVILNLMAWILIALVLRVVNLALTILILMVLNLVLVVLSLVVLVLILIILRPIDLVLIVLSLVNLIIMDQVLDLITSDLIPQPLAIVLHLFLQFLIPILVTLLYLSLPLKQMLHHGCDHIDLVDECVSDMSFFCEFTVEGVFQVHAPCPHIIVHFSYHDHSFY
jgi:hypothetical protein